MELYLKSRRSKIKGKGQLSADTVEKLDNLDGRLPRWKPEYSELHLLIDIRVRQ